MCEIYILIKRSSFLLLFVFAFSRRKVGKRNLGNCFVQVLYFYQKRDDSFFLKKLCLPRRKEASIIVLRIFYIFIKGRKVFSLYYLRVRDNVTVNRRGQKNTDCILQSVF